MAKLWVDALHTGYLYAGPSVLRAEDVIIHITLEQILPNRGHASAPHEIDASSESRYCCSTTKA